MKTYKEHELTEIFDGKLLNPCHIGVYKVQHPHEHFNRAMSLFAHWNGERWSLMSDTLSGVGRLHKGMYQNLSFQGLKDRPPVITCKPKAFGGHWIMRGDKVIGEAWKLNGVGFGMSIGGPLTTIPATCWRDGKPSDTGAIAVSKPRLKDLLALAEEHFGSTV